MGKGEAIGRVAAVLALNTARHRGMARQLPTLRENAEEAAERNERAAEALGLGDAYRGALATVPEIYT